MSTLNDCPAPAEDRRTLSKAEALDFLMARVEPIRETEVVALDDALGRVLAAPVKSTIDVPGWDNSAMDGYAIRHADLAPHQGLLPVAQRIAAGSAAEPLAPGAAARIFTGAPVPEGADTVVVQEICERNGEQVQIPLDCKSGANIRRAGEDIRMGAEVIPAGTRLAAQHLGLAASVGSAQLEVMRRLRVAVFASGDELVSPGQPLGPGQIYNSNRFSMMAMLKGWGCETLDLGTVPDTLEATIDALARGARQADLVVASGGVSVGEEDHIKPAVEHLGSLELANINIRPGKPVAFGRIQGTPFFGSPGNPVSLFVVFCLFARPFILRMQGIQSDLTAPIMKVRAGFDWPKPDKRTEFHRARLELGPEGEPELAVFPSRSSAVLSSVAWAHGLVEIPPSQVVQRGDLVDFRPFSDLLG